MKLKLAFAFAATTALVQPALAEDITIGLMGDITGPIAAMAPPVMKVYDFAIQQINDQGGMLAGDKLVGAIGDSGCNPQLAADAAAKVVNVSGAIAMVGPWCSGAVIAAANGVTIPAGVMTITPAGTSPAITTLDDKDLVYRTVPSDEYQGQVVARYLLANGTKKVAVAFLNNDYGKGLAEAFKTEFEKGGGEIAGYAAHEEGKASYRTDIAELAKGGADTLMLFDYGDGPGLTILRESIENGFFKNFVGGDGMKTQAPIDGVGADNLGTFISSSPVGAASPALDAFNAAFAAAGGDPAAVFATTGYDAVFMTAMAIELAKGDKAGIPAALRAISSGEGEAVGPGEWAKAKELIAAGKPLHYNGASGPLNFDANGDVPGTYSMFKVEGGAWSVLAELK